MKIEIAPLTNHNILLVVCIRRPRAFNTTIVVTAVIVVVVVVQMFKVSVSGSVQNMKLSMSGYKYITVSVKESTSLLRLL